MTEYHIITQYSTGQHSLTQYSKEQHSITQYNTEHHIVAQYNTAQCSTGKTIREAKEYKQTNKHT